MSFNYLVDDVLTRARDLEFSTPMEIHRFLYLLSKIPSPYRESEHKLKGIFIHVPKAAGTSVSAALFSEKARHISVSRYFAFDSELASKYFKFSFVRNPWDRFLSAYNYLACRVGADQHYRDHRWATHYLSDCNSFEMFVDRMIRDQRYRKSVCRYIHFRNQVDWLLIPGGNELSVDFVGRFESLRDDFEYVCSRLEVSAELPHKRNSGGGDYKDLYSEAAKDLVSELYHRDIKYFGYRFGD